MAITIDNAFIERFNAEVKQQYGTGSVYLPHVKKHSNVIGATDTFQYLGGVVANTKTRNGDLTFLDPAHSTVSITLLDRYAGIFVDDLDKKKSNVDFVSEYTKTIANALGVATDTIIRDAVQLGTNSTTTATGGLTYAKLLEIVKYFNEKKVPFSERMLSVGPQQISEALAITQLTSADYNNMLAVQSGEIKQVLGMTWILDPDLPVVADTTDYQNCFAYHKQAVGVSIGQEQTIRMDYVPTKAAWSVVGKLSMGSKIIDNDGVVIMKCEV